MTDTIAFEEQDGVLRRALTEPQWRAVLATSGDLDTVAWAEPDELADPDEVKSLADVPVDTALSEAVRMRGSAVLEVEVAAVSGDRGVLATVWTDGRVASSLVRGLDVTPVDGESSTNLRAGVEVSAFPLSRLLDEVLRLVPPAPVTVDAPAAVVPEELTIALARGLRTADRALVQAICRDLLIPGPPAVVEAAVATMDGSLVISSRSAGREGTSVLSLVRCAAGWVELARGRDGMVAHTPRTPEDIGRILLIDLSGRLDTVLRATGDAA
ncbi:hypothetical protein [Sanguibacter sp. 25GB23B1]|uniref:hypothetical protein n=1 Tax=unclassified Sanguibacter TaxID=2645534 RepID=UPI0032AECFE0